MTMNSHKSVKWYVSCHMIEDVSHVTSFVNCWSDRGPEERFDFDWWCRSALVRDIQVARTWLSSHGATFQIPTRASVYGLLLLYMDFILNSAPKCLLDSIPGRTLKRYMNRTSYCVDRYTLRPGWKVIICIWIIELIKDLLGIGRSVTGIFCEYSFTVNTVWVTGQNDDRRRSKTPGGFKSITHTYNLIVSIVGIANW